MKVGMRVCVRKWNIREVPGVCRVGVYKHVRQGWETFVQHARIVILD